MSSEYAAALETMRVAQRVFDAKTQDYRFSRIGDSEFLNARMLFKLAESDFDKAYTKEESNG